jgi:hypothetical protein
MNPNIATRVSEDISAAGRLLALALDADAGRYADLTDQLPHLRADERFPIVAVMVAPALAPVTHDGTEARVPKRISPV